MRGGLGKQLVESGTTFAALRPTLGFLYTDHAYLYPGHGPEDIRRYPGHIPLATSTTVLSGLDFCAKCDFCVKGWVRGICMWRILWFWCFLMI